jgi:hypothetical protein
MTNSAGPYLKVETKSEKGKEKKKRNFLISVLIDGTILKIVLNND